ncbi:hypothetical protein BDF20DRAFT_821516 [Mycotypha africana]|uniref:uncharacterized protein n=1 Tax=Mycotypha africana TaxID=64632 RepID=UPI0023007BCD|nr:uncharacterized protein BDF20DRAFT_821516 [Mycotypha africana]KAI8977155.1 hypothetical protein BDF20DRAFT_821516 [Mycotypha africana]
MSSVNYTVEDLKPRILQNIEDLEYKAAYKFCKKALELEPKNATVLEMMGQVELELGYYESARKHLLESIQLEPNAGYSKYMYLGQMSVAKDAIEAFQKGVDLMVIERNKLPADSEDSKVIASKISSALCSMTELYLTDLCFEPEAEQKCEEYTKHALEVDPNNSEVYQTLASVRLSQQRQDEARQALTTAMELWIHKDLGDPAIPIYESRLNLVKLLLEVGMFDHAFTVLENLQKENEEVVDLWYLYGWTYYCLGDEDDRSPEDKTTLWADARDCLETAVRVK